GHASPGLPFELMSPLLHRPGVRDLRDGALVLVVAARLAANDKEVDDVGLRIHEPRLVDGERAVVGDYTVDQPRAGEAIGGRDVPGLVQQLDLADVLGDD